MRSFLLILFVCFLILPAVSSADTEITSLPWTCNTPGERYYLTQNLDWPGSSTNTQAILITADSVELDFQGFAITFGSGNVGYQAGVKADNVEGILIHGGTLQHTPADSTLDLNRTRAIWFNWVKYSTIRDMDYISVTGTVVDTTDWAASGRFHDNGINTIYMSGEGNYGNRIVNNTIENAVVGFFERADRPACAIGHAAYPSSDSGIVDPNVDYTLKIDSNTIYFCQTGALLGRAVGGGTVDHGVFHVEYNQFIGRLRNDGPVNGGYPNGNAFAVDYYHPMHVKSTGNKITGDTTAPFLGTGGFFVISTGLSGSFPNDTNRFINDTVIVFGADPDALISGMKIRNDNKPTTFSNCYFEARVDTFAATTWMDNQAQCVEIGHSYEPADWENPHISFHNTTFKTVDVSGGSTPTIMFYRYWPLGYNYRLFTEGCHFESDGAIFRFTHDMDITAPDQADSIFSYNDTFALGSNHSGVPIFDMILNNREARYNHIVNPTYESGAFFEFNVGTAQTQDLTEQIILTITVQDSVASAVEGATVYIINDFDDTVGTGTTNASGIFVDTVSTNFISRADPDTTNAQYNPFVISAVYDVYSTDSTDSIGPGTGQEQTITLDFEVGDSPNALASVAVDSLVSDFSGETDSARIITTTNSGSTSDSIIITYATNGYPDSNGVNRISYAYNASTVDTNIFTLDINETDTLYVSYWTKTDADVWTTRGTAFEEFYAAPIDVESPAKIENLVIMRNGVIVIGGN